MNNKWFLLTSSFVLGALVGAFSYAAVDYDHNAQITDMSDFDSMADMSEPAVTADDLEQNERFDEVVLPDIGDRDERWATVSETLAILNQRVTELEAQLADIALASPIEDDAASTTAKSYGMKQDTLIAAGVDPGVAEAIMRQENQLELQRLELRDQASREGWIDSERFFEELRALNGDAGILREEIGDVAYDRFLYLSGQPNRVVIDSVIEGSPAQLAGIEAGDIVLDYADNRVFAWLELRNATREGSRGEDVIIRVQRNGEVLELALPRGPIGVRLDSEQVDPDANT